MADLGAFRIDIEIENPARPGVKRVVKSALVDTGAELSARTAQRVRLTPNAKQSGRE
ncbi:MAG TPA: hypothetical protein VH277_18245 [Gemmatimonadaceae bacterium]|jgi:hypothetical protein|nr:hypothetical protein [Gemmatimonadaceae bacterium]